MSGRRTFFEDEVPFGSLFKDLPRNGIYKSKEHQGHGDKLVKMGELFKFSRVHSSYSGFDRISLSERERGKLLLRNHDLLFSRTSVDPDGVGKCSIVILDSESLTFDSNMIRLRLDENQACPLFYFYYFSSPDGRAKVKSLASGAAITTIAGSKLAALSVPFPTLSTQHRIADILAAYDDLIANNARRIAILEEMARALYREWFVEFRFPGHEGVRLVESTMGLIPEGWDQKVLGDLAQEIRRTVAPNQIDPTTPYFGLEHLPRRSIALSEWGMVNEVKSTKLAFKRGEILFGKIRPYFHKVGVAPLDGVCSSDAIVIRPIDPSYHSVLLSCVSSDDFVAHATQTSQGTKMPRANWDILLKYPIVVPPYALREQFDHFVEDVVKDIRNLILRNRNLRETRDFLLPQMIAGEIEATRLGFSNEEIGQ